MGGRSWDSCPSPSCGLLAPSSRVSRALSHRCHRQHRGEATAPGIPPVEVKGAHTRRPQPFPPTASQMLVRPLTGIGCRGARLKGCLAAGRHGAPGLKSCRDPAISPRRWDPHSWFLSSLPSPRSISYHHRQWMFHKRRLFNCGSSWLGDTLDLSPSPPSTPKSG